MNHQSEIPASRDALLEAFAAELAVAAYRVALPTTNQAAWLDLQLDLWKVLADKVKTWGRELCGTPTAGDAGRAQQRRVT